MTNQSPPIDTDLPLANVGGVVLCGGHSRRMGFSKALLPFGGETLLQRVVRRLAETISPIAVVHATDQEMPPLEGNVICVADDEPDQGPLRGLACGLSALADSCEFAFATSCDAPFITNAFIRRLAELREEKTVAMLTDEQRHYPLCAIYATELGSIAMDLLRRGARRPIALLESVDHTLVPVDSLRSADSTLASLININDPQAYRDALEREGIAIDEPFIADLGRDENSDQSH